MGADNEIITDCQKLIEWSFKKQNEWDTPEFWVKMHKSLSILRDKYNREHRAVVLSVLDLIYRLYKIKCGNTDAITNSLDMIDLYLDCKGAAVNEEN